MKSVCFSFWGFSDNDKIALNTLFGTNIVFGGDIFDLDAHRGCLFYIFPEPYTKNDVVAMAIDGDNEHSYLGYDNYRVTAGTTTDLGVKRSEYSLPPGYTPADIVGMAIDGSNNWVFTWFE